MRLRRASFAPNLEPAGRKLRWVAGSASVVGASFLLLAFALPAESTALGLLAAALMALGVFLLFEARASWCWLRALGFRTPL